jgi:hypothetical protein
MVGGAIADSAPTPEPRVRALRRALRQAQDVAQDRLSPHVALQNAGHCHWHHWTCGLVDALLEPEVLLRGLFTNRTHHDILEARTVSDLEFYADRS